MFHNMVANIHFVTVSTLKILQHHFLSTFTVNSSKFCQSDLLPSECIFLLCAVCLLHTAICHNLRHFVFCSNLSWHCCSLVVPKSPPFQFITFLNNFRHPHSRRVSHKYSTGFCYSLPSALLTFGVDKYWRLSVYVAYNICNLKRKPKTQQRSTLLEAFRFF